MWKKQLLNLTGNDWREVRTSETPNFTSGKMKMMLRFLKASAEEISKEINRLLKMTLN
jgi:hypothetical protein